MRPVQMLLLVVVLLAGASPAGATAIHGVETGSAGFVGLSAFGPLDEPVFVASLDQFVAAFGADTAGLVNPWLAPSVAAFFANGGQRLFVVRVSDADDASLIGVDGGAPGVRTGLQALRDVDEVSVVAIPGAVSGPVQAALIAHCEAERDRMAVLDPVSAFDVNAVVAQRASLSSALGFAALYFPWVVAAPMGESLTLPPSGFAAGAYARTTPPQPPTGVVVTATDVSVRLASQQVDALTQAGVDAIRFFAAAGIQIWGARTIASDSEWRYVNVRRMGLYLEESIFEGTQWAVFEPNDATLWASLRACVEDFLVGLWQAGWFPAATPQQAFFVRVDQSTMTQQDIDEGRTVLQVGFAPVQPGEFVLLRIVHQRNLGTGVPARDQSPLRLDPPAPNPFNPTTSIRFDLPAAAHVELGIYDASGRLVRALLRNDPLRAGPHAVTWDGRDSLGAPTASGVYLCRLTAGRHSAFQRVTLAK